MPFVFDSSCSSTTTALFRPVVNIADVRTGAEPPPAAAAARGAAFAEGAFTPLADTKRNITAAPSSAERAVPRT